MTPNRTRTRLVVLGSLAVVVVAAPASAVDRYDDVDPSSVHAPAIGELADAGISAGCSPERFCPRDAVTRQQMASFLARAASRTSFDTNGTGLSSSNDYQGVPASVQVRSAGASGGTSTVTLTGSVSVYAEGNVSSCPCEVEAFVYRDSDDAQGPSSWTQLPGSVTGSGRAVTSVPVTWVATIPSGSTETFRVAVLLNDGSPSGVQAEASLSATITPF